MHPVEEAVQETEACQVCQDDLLVYTHVTLNETVNAPWDHRLVYAWIGPRGGVDIQVYNDGTPRSIMLTGEEMRALLAAYGRHTVVAKD